METIITLLFILLPVIFKLIEKKLKDSSKAQQADAVREIADLFKEEEEPVKEEERVDDVRQPVKPASVVVLPPVAPKQEYKSYQTVAQQRVEVKNKTVSKASSPKKSVAEKKDKKIKIDPKNLVIYSEIMKPKYKE